ncbi:hypothetical protein [Hyphomicrobium sp.]|uniref:hypothetical protein n=1 Tax=Hyphomicrobium sp. TaxID=82 RepID=UPI0013285B95|nr:hypothetical protein [Hyphomicrobium sp.]KAB2937391.1 MAG: hypothetical protein F9K20_20070 [Hyphomicrobium sp.]
MARKDASAAAPTYILLLEDCAEWRAGKVLLGTAEVEQKLQAAKAKYRPATKRECELHGIAD